MGAALLLLLAGLWAAGAQAGAAAPADRPNVLIISVCSLRRDRIGLYGAPEETAPNLRRLAGESLVFRNAYTSKPWSSPRRFIAGISPEELSRLGYENIELPEARRLEAEEIAQERAKARSLSLERLEAESSDRKRYPLSTDILARYHEEGLREIEKALKKERPRPFFLHVHFKYMHRPYYPPELTGAAPDFPARARPRLEEFLAGKPAGEHRLPAYAILLDRGDLLFPQAASAAFEGNPLGALNRRDLLARWRRSPDFADDLRLIVSAYDWKLRRFDASLGGLLSLYGDQRLRGSTVVVFVGDHGEAFMEHGFLMHGETVYDEELAVPLLVRFPQGARGESVRRQIHQRALADILRAVLAGRLTGPDAARFAREDLPDEPLLATNFTFTQRALRARNKWKFIYDFAADTRRLYDLEADPREQRDVFALHPDLAARLEEILISHQDPGTW